jgi:hypothetical protein
MSRSAHSHACSSPIYPLHYPLVHFYKKNTPARGTRLPALLGAARDCPLPFSVHCRLRVAARGCWPCQARPAVVAFLLRRAAAAAAKRCQGTSYKRRRATASSELHMPTTLFSQATRRCYDVLKTHVASVYFKCFRCFRGMLQVFQMGVAKVDRKCCICCNSCTCMLQRSIPNVSFVFPDILLQLCLTGCCIHFTHILQVFY